MSNLIKCMIPFVSLLSIQLHAAQHSLDKNSHYLFGDWQGMRTELLTQGIKLDANLIVDSAYLADGGYNSGNDPKYASQFLIGSTLDLEKLANWEGMTLKVTITARQGQSLSSEDISDPSAPQLANVQANYGRGNSKSRLTEFSLEKNFKQQGLSIKLGRLGIGTDFNVMSCEFQNNSFCAAQMGKWQSGIWYNSPISQWGGRLKYQFHPDLAAQIGVYEYNPQNALERHGWNLSTHHADGVTIPIEMIWQPKSLINGLAGTYRVGAMYNSADQAKNQKDIRTGQQQNHTYGAWFNFDQQLTSVGVGKQGLHSFANFTFHSRTTNKVDQSQQIGLKYYGVISSRAEDNFGFALNRIHINDRFTEDNKQFNADAEYNIELNYSYYPTKWLMLRPSLQYIVHPGATHDVNNAWVLALGTKLNF
ncbi:carbohydrate porin [Acinetobacter sp. AG3]|jgi:porin|uniref:carbohydrate porin n=1 Tax=unclassified Acinetobacter TaxID=196816 RepID=UPI001EF0152E|nr:carbohydrate porin [Acinetobacter sp. AG3]MCG7221114.1 carbohydrate porin [Acinetobacter sp. AG3]